MTDFTHKEALGKLLRYESSALDTGKLTSLADYVKRLPPEQKEIYCLLAPNRAAAESSPYFEVFRERKFEVLFLHDPWDEFVIEHLNTFDGKPLKLAEKAELNLSEPKKTARCRGMPRSRWRNGLRKRWATRWAKCGCRSGWWTVQRWWWTRTSL